MSWLKRVFGKGGGDNRPAAPPVRPAKTVCDHGNLTLRQGSAEFEYFVARGELETTHNLEHGASHLSNLLTFDPGRAEWIELLERYLAAAGSNPESLIPREEKLYYGTEAIRAYIWQRNGRLEEATDLLVNVTHAKPDALYLEHWALDWLEPQGAVERLSVPLTHRLFSLVLTRYAAARYNTATRRRWLRRWCALNQRLPASNWMTGAPAMMRAGLLRKAGMYEAAETFATASLEAQPDWHIATAVGLILWERGKIDHAEVAFLKALQLDPNDITARLEAGDMFHREKKWQTALRWYQSALAKEPQHPWARPSAMYCTWKLSGDEEPPNELVEMSRAGNQRASNLMWEEYGNKLPEPVDATANILRKHRDELATARGADGGHTMTIRINCLEAPSNYLAFRLDMESLQTDLKLVITAERVQQPDPREPLAAVKYPLWRYEGTDAIPALPQPPAEVATAIGELASARFDDQQNWAAASEVAERLGPDRIGEILAVMVHPPAVPADSTALEWLPRVQHAAAQVAAQVDRGWEGSARHDALLSILHGPRDWATVAAIRALARFGCEEPALAVSIHDAFQLLAAQQPDQGYCWWEYALYQNWLHLPHLFPREREEFERRLKAMQEEKQPATT